jgi:hypothetical protein
MQHANTVPQDLEDDIRSAAQGAIQQTTDAEMVKIEKAIHQTPSKRGKALTAQAKMEMHKDLDDHCHKLQGLLVGRNMNMTS